MQYLVIAGAVAGVVAAVVAVIGILIALGVIGGDERTPKVDSISRTEVIAGQPVDILGKNLGLVSEVRLTKGIDISIGLTYALVNESQLTVVVPDTVKPDRYNLLFKAVSGDSISTGQQLTVSSSSAATTQAPVTPAPISVPTPTPTLEQKPAPERPPTPAPGPPPLGRIAFTSYRDGYPEIYVMNADGANQTRLTVNPAGDHRPAWSGWRHLAFMGACNVS